MKRNLIILVISAVLILALVIASTLFLRDFSPSRTKKTLKSNQNNSEEKIGEPSATSAATDNAPKKEDDQPDASVAKSGVPIPLPAAFTKALSENALTIEDLSKKRCQQLILVSSDQSSAHLDFYTFQNNRWIIDSELSCEGYVGRNGVTKDMHENSNASPIGLYAVGDAFYIHEKPKTGLPTFQITQNTYWVDDPDSKYYNRKVEGTINKDWKSAEHMIDYKKSYEYGFVIEYNTNAVYNAGSAIFFHVSSSPTAGCIATDRKMVLQYLSKLDSSKNPYILISVPID